jgi:hypothetical protein
LCFKRRPPKKKKKTAALTHRDDIGIRVTKPVIIFGSNIQAWLDEMCDILGSQLAISNHRFPRRLEELECRDGTLQT